MHSIELNNSITSQINITSFRDVPIDYQVVDAVEQTVKCLTKVAETFFKSVAETVCFSTSLESTVKLNNEILDTVLKLEAGIDPKENNYFNLINKFCKNFKNFKTELQKTTELYQKINKNSEYEAAYENCCQFNKEVIFDSEAKTALEKLCTSSKQFTTKEQYRLHELAENILQDLHKLQAPEGLCP